MPASCVVCGDSLEGRASRYCGARCKFRGYRRRQAGLAEDAHPNWRRGPIPLGGMSRAEAAAAAIARILAERPR